MSNRSNIKCTFTTIFSHCVCIEGILILFYLLVVPEETHFSILFIQISKERLVGVTFANNISTGTVFALSAPGIKNFLIAGGHTVLDIVVFVVDFVQLEQ